MLEEKFLIECSYHSEHLKQSNAADYSIYISLCLYIYVENEDKIYLIIIYLI